MLHENIFIVQSESPEATDGILKHFTALLAGLRGNPVEVFWFVGYPGSDFQDVGTQLRKFFLSLWVARDFRLMAESDYVALSLEIGRCATPDDYFRLNLAALSAKISGSEIFLVLDLHQATAAARQRIVALAERVLSGARGWRGGLAVVGASSHERADLRFITPPSSLRALFEHWRAASNADASEAAAPELLHDAARFVHPLIALNQPAQREVLDYVLRHGPELNNELRRSLEREAFWKLGNDRIRLSPRALAGFRECVSYNAGLGAFRDTVPNGAKILSFQGIGSLLRQVSGLDELYAAASSASRIVDLFALAVTQRRDGDARFDETTRSLHRELARGGATLIETGNANAQALLCYASQLLLVHAAEFGLGFFRLLEELTFSYADSLRLYHGEHHPRMYEASRWLTNLGYIYDKVRPFLGGRSAMRASIFDKAAAHLSKLAPEDTKELAAIRYSEAWQLWDANLAERSIRCFTEAAERVLGAAREEPITDRMLLLMAQELFVIALALAPDRRLGESERAFLEEMLEEYGSKHGLSKVAKAFRDGAILVDAPGPAPGLKDDVVIVTAYPDIHVGLLAAQAFRRRFHRVVKLIVVPSRGDHDIEPLLTGTWNLIIGAPDTPGPIGEFVSGCDPELVRLYQLRLLGTFGASVEGRIGERPVHFLAACGLAGNVYAWQAFLEAHANELERETRPMDELLRQLLLPPLVAAETKVVGAFIDRLLSKVTRKREQARTALEKASKATPAGLDRLVGGLDEDVKAALVDIANPAAIAEALDEAMSMLRSKDLDFNQLLSLATLAYDYAMQLQRSTRPASAEEQHLAVYVTAFRNQRSEADSLRLQYLAASVKDHRALNEAAETLARSLRNFRDLATTGL
jgi:hypothetical protein